MSFNIKHSVVLTYHYTDHGIQGGYLPEAGDQKGVTFRSHILFKTLSHWMLDKISIFCNIVRINRRSAKVRARDTGYNECCCHQTPLHPLLSSWLSGHKFRRTLSRFRELQPVQTTDEDPHSLWCLTPQATNPHTQVTPAPASWYLKYTHTGSE